MYNYTVKKTNNYKVILKPNDFYSTDTLEAGNYYPSKAVKNYMIDFVYDFKANMKADIEYNYNVTAELIGTSASTEGKYKELWRRKFDILETKTGKINEDNFNINEDVSIDYEYYNNLVNSYEEAYDVELDTVLKVKFNIIFSNLNGEKMKDYIELDINLNDVITNAEENYESVKTNNVPEAQKNDNGNKILICSIFGIIFLILILISIKKLKNKTPKEKYKRKVRYTLKYCKDLIVRVEEKPNFSKLNILKIDNLDSLINLAEHTKSNIIYYETIKDRKSEFFIINNNYVYIYTIRIK